jgi:hypothetical protein
MKLITLRLTVKELDLLTTLAAEQLFRKEFIDSRMPGYRSHPEEMNLGKSLVGRLRLRLFEQLWHNRRSKNIRGLWNLECARGDLHRGK